MLTISSIVALKSDKIFPMEISTLSRTFIESYDKKKLSGKLERAIKNKK